MSWLNDNDISWMQEAVGNLLPDSCIIKSVGTTSDGAGGWIESYTAVDGGTVNCRVDPADQEDVTIKGAERVKFSYNCYMPSMAPVTEDDVIEYQGELYEIVFIEKSVSWQTHTMAGIERFS